jgi:hypothetical protein
MKRNDPVTSEWVEPGRFGFDFWQAPGFFFSILLLPDGNFPSLKGVESAADHSSPSMFEFKSMLHYSMVFMV